LLLSVLRLAGLLPVLGRARLCSAVHLAVLDGLAELRRAGLAELALVRRWALPWTAVVRPRVAVPVPLLGLVLGVVVPTGWIAHRESIT
jgi:hypothetical protein